MAESESIKVAIRMRPLNDREKNSGQEALFKCLNQNSIGQLKDGREIDHNSIYQYDRVFDETSSTEGVYDFVAKEVVSGVANGINGTIFACNF